MGIWPPAPAAGEDHRELTQRMQTYMEKATREAKLHTSWINPDAEYDRAVRDFVAAVLDDQPKNRFLADFRRFNRQIAGWGLYSCLVATAAEAGCSRGARYLPGRGGVGLQPGGPRQPPTGRFCRARKDALGASRPGPQERSLLSVARELGRNPSDPRAKLFLTWRTLQLRRRAADLFHSGDYLPLEAEGAKAVHVCAFARQLAGAGLGDGGLGAGGEARRAGAIGEGDGRAPAKMGTVPFSPPMAVVIAPRLLAQLTPLPPEGAAPPPLGPDVWGDTRLVLPHAPAALRNVFTGQTHSPAGSRLSLAELLADFPVALLTVEPPLR